MESKASEEILTERLLLRRPCHRDAQNIFRSYAGDPAVTRYMNWPTHRSVADSWAFLEWSELEWERWPAGPYLIFRRDAELRRAIGGTGLLFYSDEKAAVGYALAQSAWGMGYATEALTAMVDLGRQLALQELEAVCHVDHSASARVLEKCGFRLQGRRAQKTYFPNAIPEAQAETLLYSLRF